MATRSRIGIYINGRVNSIYCHWDGYPAHNGDILLHHYDTAKTLALIAEGDVSSLAPQIGEKHAFSAYEQEEISREEYDRLYGHMTTFYRRDRGATGCDARISDSWEQFLEQVDNCGGEYYYIIKDGVWYFGTLHERETGEFQKLVNLADYMEREAAMAVE